MPPARPVIVGFPQDEGVRRNGGRVGAALAPAEIRRWLYRLVAFAPHREADLAALGVVDAGDLPVTGDLEASQAALAEVVGGLLGLGAVPIVLGGGHETALGVYLGHVRAGQPAGILNLDAHLDVRPTLGGLGHSGSPFRQALEWPDHPLPGPAYTCLGAQPFAVSGEHLLYIRQRGGVVAWRDEVAGCLDVQVKAQIDRLRGLCGTVHLSIDADVAAAADVPGVSAPNPTGLEGAELARAALVAGAEREVTSLELVEINPRLDLDGRSARWAAVAVWHFLAGLALRRGAY
jgi:formimidoylglutamase